MSRSRCSSTINRIAVGIVELTLNKYLRAGGEMGRRISRPRLPQPLPVAHPVFRFGPAGRAVAEILGLSAGWITCRHDAHRVPLAFKAIMTLPQPSAFLALVNGYDGECPCCRRRFADAC